MSDAVREAFTEQAFWCRKLGSQFTALVCEALAKGLDRSTATGRKVLDWPGDAGAQKDVVPLRLAGALHGLVQTGQAPALAALYPPNPQPDPEVLAVAVTAAVASHDGALAARLDIAPQTNEVGRSGSLMTGLLHLADRFRLPFALYELGCSAGLNLNLGRFAYDLGGVKAGDAASPVRITPAWDGPAPPAAPVKIRAASGVDISPLSVEQACDRELLVAYIWPDQAERLERAKAAIALARTHPPAVEQGDAADWLERRLAGPQAGVCQVVYSTIAYQYFPPAVQARIQAHLEHVGQGASDGAPLAWLRLETDPAFDNAYSLRLTTWPDGEETVLGLGHPHGKNFRHF